MKKDGTSSEIFGQVTDRKTNQPLSYVNIGILNRETGTVTNTESSFRLSVKDEFTNDTIRISRIGYKPVELAVRQLKEWDGPLSIALEEQVNELHEVIVTARAFK